MRNIFGRILEKSLFRGILSDQAAVSYPGAPSQIDFGVNVTNDSAMKITALYAGIRIRSENIASLSKKVIRMDDDRRAIATDHPAYRLISVKPNPYTSRFDFWNSINAALDGWGNAYAIIQRDRAGTPIALHQVHPVNVSITVVGGEKFYKVNISDQGLRFLNGTYPDYDMCHFMLVTFDGIKGVNPIVYNAIALGKAIATQKFGADYYKKGGNIKAVLETDSALGDKQYRAFLEHYQASAGNFETPLLEYGIKYKQIGISPVAAQLVQSETISIQDVCRIINIPPHMVAELSHATFSNIEHQTIQFVQYALRPSCKRIEIELEDKLFFDDEKGKYSVKFDLNSLMRGDTATRTNYYHNAIQDGWLTLNEAREMEGFSHRDGLDISYAPANMNIIRDGDIVPGNAPADTPAGNSENINENSDKPDEDE